DHRTCQSNNSAHGMHDTRAGEINGPMAQIPVLAGLSEPTTAPDPVRINAVWKGDPEPIQAKAFPTPAFGHRSRGDRGRRIHEHHHEEENPHDADVFQSRQEKALSP